MPIMWEAAVVRTEGGMEISRPEGCQVEKCGRKAGEHEPPRDGGEAPRVVFSHMGKTHFISRTGGSCVLYLVDR